MHILISNDDGYRAPGIVHLANHFGRSAEIDVVAPDRDRSGASNSLTLDRPLRVRTAENGFRYVEGTPTDCVHLAVTGLLDREPDIVISGINSGANLGDDVLYSGTVAAAMEGRFLGLPAMAVSLAGDNPTHYPSAVQAVQVLVAGLGTHPIAPNTILNLNVPDLPWDQIKGFEATRLGNRHKAEGVVRTTDPRGRLIYWIGPPGCAQDAGDGTDFDAVRRGFVSVTPLHVDLTRHSVLTDLRTWLKTVRDR